MSMQSKDEHALESPAISRREALRRGAIVGGTVVWAAPAVQHFGISPALAGTPEPEDPPEEPPEEEAHGISYVGFVFFCNGTQWRAKWEEEGGGRWVNVESVKAPHYALPHCGLPNGWLDATGLPDAPNIPDKPTSIDVGTTVDGGDLISVSFTLPQGCSFVDGSGVAMGAGGDKTDQGYCEAPQLSADGRTVTFTAPPKN